MARGAWQVRREGTGVVVACAVMAAIGGCRLGPEYARPAVRTEAEYAGVGRTTALPLPGDASAAVAEEADLSRWWELLGDAVLTGLIERAAAGNLSLEMARARIVQARAATAIAESAFYPSVTLGSGATRSRAAGGRHGNSFRVGLDASWEADIFGGNRRSLEVSEAQLEAAIEDHRAFLVSLAGEVASDYFALRGAQSQLATARRNLAAQQTTLDLTRQRFEAGFVSALDVANAEAQVASTTARIPTLEATVRASIYAIGVLLGEPPGALLEELMPEGPIGAPPPRVPVGLPSDLLERRPDIRAAGARLHAATARVGVAIADMYPRFALTVSAGIGGPRVEDVGTLANRSWSIGPSISWPIYRGGALRAGVEAQRAAAEEALAGYKSAVLSALQEVETNLVNFQNEQARLEALTATAEANRRAVDLALQLYNAGRTDFLNVLSAQRQLFSAEDELVQSRRQVLTSLVGLYKSLGGGWDAGAGTP
jgi:multidrug efflux system outer membrane protein